MPVKKVSYRIFFGYPVLISKISYQCTRMVLYELVDSRSFLGY